MLPDSQHARVAIITVAAVPTHAATQASEKRPVPSPAGGAGSIALPCHVIASFRVSEFIQAADRHLAHSGVRCAR